MRPCIRAHRGACGWQKRDMLMRQERQLELQPQNNGTGPKARPPAAPAPGDFHDTRFDKYTSSITVDTPGNLSFTFQVRSRAAT